jgi:hypothetical protein
MPVESRLHFQWHHIRLDKAEGAFPFSEIKKYLHI